MKPTPLKLYVLGPPRLERDGRPLHLTQRKDLALLIYLAFTRQAYHRDSLAALLWPDLDSQTARGNLRRTLHRLRSALGAESLAAEADTVYLDPQAGLWLDAQEFQRLAAEYLPQSDEEAGLAGLAEAAALYTADFLAGFTLRDSPEFDDWQFFESENLRQTLARVLVRLAELCARRGDYAAATAYARRWLALDPLHEPAHRLLMRLYAQAGQYSAALRQYETCVQILKEQLGADPEPETTALYQQIRTGPRQPAGTALAAAAAAPPAAPAAAPPASPAAQAVNFPTYLTPFVGREAELDEIIARLADPACRLLTLTGPGGSGKTRLAIQAAQRLPVAHCETCSEGVFFVPLQPLNTADELTRAAAEALGFAFLHKGPPPIKQLQDYLRSRQVLLVLDNAEHLLDEGRAGSSLAWVTDMLSAAPKLKFLVTSRTRLSLQGEHLYPVGGLKTPELPRPGAAGDPQMLAEAYSALQLFLQGARRVQPEFELTSENLPGVARVCQLVQGLPLGIELAAAWIEVLSPEEIAAEIERSLDFLEAEWRDLPERQRSLRAVFESSWKALTPPEREVFQRLTVFRGGFTRQAAEEVSGASLKVLLSLANKSWLQPSGGRYTLHELLRQYASEIFQAQPDEWQATLDRHAAYYAAFLEEQGRAMQGRRQKEAEQAVSVEFQNARAAWLRLVEQKRFCDLQNRLYWLVGARRAGGIYTEVDELFALTRRAAEASQEDDAARLLLTCLKTLNVGLNYIHMPMGDAWRNEIGEAWDMAGRLAGGSFGQMGVWAVVLAGEYAKRFNLDEALDRLREFLKHERLQKDAWLQAYTLATLGALLRDVDKNEARQRLAAALELYREIGDFAEWAETLRQLGLIANETWDFPQALRFLQEALEVVEAAGDQRNKIQILWNLGGVYLHAGEFPKALDVFEQMRSVAEQAGWPSYVNFAISTAGFETARYGDLLDARQKREMALAQSEQYSSIFDRPWNHWEMGELYRVEGDPAAARRWFDRAQEQFQAIGIGAGICFYQRGRGDLALGQQAYAEALDWFQSSIGTARQEHHPWALAYALNGAGRALTGLGDLPAARQYFHQALQAARGMGDPGLALHALTGLAALLAAAGDHAEAARLSAVVLEHPVAWKETKRQAAAVLESTGTTLPPQAAFAARANELNAGLLALISEILEKDGIKDALRDN